MDVYGFLLSWVGLYWTKSDYDNYFSIFSTCWLLVMVWAGRNWKVESLSATSHQWSPFAVFITDRVRITREGSVFTRVCDSVHKGGGYIMFRSCLRVYPVLVPPKARTLARGLPWLEVWSRESGVLWSYCRKSKLSMILLRYLLRVNELSEWSILWLLSNLSQNQFCILRSSKL